MIINEHYKKQVGLLIRIMPSVYRIKNFAVHGGTAINLFHKDMPRYSIDIDITYIPIEDREKSLKTINVHLLELKQMIEKTIPGIKVVPKLDVLKLQCIKDRAIVKIEVNGTKRGIVGLTVDMNLCAKAQSEFQMSCQARIVSFSQLYGGKISAALDRQHPRDLFDCKYMPLNAIDQAKDGLLFSLTGSGKPIIESLQPNPIDQTEALKNQFEGMTDVPFSYEDYKVTRKELIEKIDALLTEDDKEFLISFEQGVPEWDKCSAGNLSAYPSVKWKMQNILKLKDTNPKKHNEGVEKLREYFSQ